MTIEFKRLIYDGNYYLNHSETVNEDLTMCVEIDDDCFKNCFDLKEKMGKIEI